MRTSFVVFLSMLLVLGFSASAFALHATETTEYNPGMVTKEGVQIEMSGHIRARGEYKSNTSPIYDGNGDFVETNDSQFNHRVRLKFQVRVTPNTMGVIEVQTGDEDSDTYGWGSGSGAKGVYDEGDYQPSTINIRQAYIAHQGSGLLGRTAGIKVGHLLMALGNGLFYDHTLFGDDAIILWTELGDGEISLNYVKMDEGSSGLNDDGNAYVLAVDYPMDNIVVGADVTYVDHQRGFEAPPLTYSQRFAGGTMTEDFHLWNFGIRGDIDIAGLKVRGDVELQTGDTTVSATGEEVDFEGYAFLVGAEYMLGDINLGAEFAYGSGQEADDEDIETFVTALSNQQHYTYVYDYRYPTSLGRTGTGIANTWYINVSASAKPMPDLKVMADFYYLQASEDVLADSGKEEDELGYEIDAKIEYEIDKNLTYYVEGGYFFPGDVYDGPNDDADDAYAVRNGIILKF